MGCSSSSSNESSYIDISKEPNWNPDKAWVIDIIVEGAGDGEANSNFLFQADIQADGTVENKTCDASNEKAYIVLDNDMYDINSFIGGKFFYISSISIIIKFLWLLDQEYDGQLSFTVAFGANSPRGPTAAKGFISIISQIKCFYILFNI